VSEFVPAILWEEATEAGHVWQRRFYDFVVFSESKRIQKLRYMAGWPTCPRVAFFNASESRAPPPIGIGGAVAHPPPSRPGELHPGPLTEPVVSLSTYHGSCHPSKTAAFRRDQRAPPVTSWPITIPTRVTCSLRSPAVNPVHRYYGAVRPWSAHCYFPPHGTSTCASSLSIADQVLKFRTKARIRVTAPVHRTWHST